VVYDYLLSSSALTPWAYEGDVSMAMRGFKERKRFKFDVDLRISVSATEKITSFFADAARRSIYMADALVDIQETAEGDADISSSDLFEELRRDRTVTADSRALRSVEAYLASLITSCEFGLTNALKALKANSATQTYRDLLPQADIKALEDQVSAAVEELQAAVKQHKELIDELSVSSYKNLEWYIKFKALTAANSDLSLDKLERFAKSKGTTVKSLKAVAGKSLALRNLIKSLRAAKRSPEFKSLDKTFSRAK